VDRKWWPLVAVCTGIFMLLLDINIVVVAQPSIQKGLHAGLSDLQWTLDAYALTLASLLLTWGVIADRYGRKLVFSVGLVVFTAGSLLCGLSVDPVRCWAGSSPRAGTGGASSWSTCRSGWSRWR
jgi:MFS family permease